jgi:glycosyltransferase involved in cell wall biosynthesis
MTKKSNKLVSVIIPCYNRASIIERCIESVKSQKGNFDIEILVVDDGSTDNTKDIIKKFKNVQYIKIEHSGGPSKPRNIGMQEASGEYFAFIDSDDEWAPDKIQKQISIIEKYNCDIVYTDAYYITESNKVIKERMLPRGIAKSGLIFNDLVFSNFIPLSSVLMKKGVYSRVGGFTENEEIGFEDYHYWLKAAASNEKFYFLDAPLLLYRIGNKKYSIKVMGSDGENLHLKKVYKDLLGKVPSLKNNIKLLKRQANRESKAFKIFNKSKRATNVAINILKVKLINLKKIDLVDRNKNVLFLIPWMTVGGADKVYLDIISNADQKKFSFFFINLEKGEKNTWKHRFEKYSKDIVDLPELIDTSAYGVFLSRYIKKYKIDTVVTSNTIEGYKLIMNIKSTKPNIKIIDILHGQSGKSDNGGSPAFSNEYSKYIDTRVTVTNYLNRYMQSKYNINKNKLMTIHNGVDTDRFNEKNIKANIFKNKHKIAANRVISWVGRFSQEKRPLEFIEFARIICMDDEYDDVVFVMAGGGILGDEIKIKIEEYKLINRFVLTGFLSNMVELYKDSNILVMTSEMEGLPIVLLEAGSMGLPVIAPKVGGIPEVINNGVNGYTVASNSKMPENMAKLAKSILVNKSIENKMGKENRSIIVRNFNLGTMVKKYEKIM